MNKMQEIRLEKVTLNIGAGALPERVENAKTLLERITARKSILTKARDRNPTFKIKKGEAIGVKITLRKKEAKEILAKSLQAVDFQISESNFDNNGSFSFGVKEYIDFPQLKYDSKIGMMGFDVCVTLARSGKRIAKRKNKKSKIPKKQMPTKQEAIDFMIKNFNAELRSE